MTKEQITRCMALRLDGHTYQDIADMVGISKNTVKSYFQRHKPEPEKTKETKESDNLCPYCGKELIQKNGVKTRRFCSPQCRQSWWNAHPEKVRQRAIYPFTCKCCGKDFTAYGNNHRKYCSHSCYVRGRFGKDGDLS